MNELTVERSEGLRMIESLREDGKFDLGHKELVGFEKVKGEREVFLGGRKSVSRGPKEWAHHRSRQCQWGLYQPKWNGSYRRVKKC